MKAYDALARIYDQFITQEERDSWLTDIPKRLKEEGIKPPMAILDLACGTGKMAICLAKLGYKVTGTDISPAMLEQAADNARKVGQYIPFIQQNMQETALHRPVDAVLCNCDGFNYMTSPDALSQTLAAVSHSLRPGGLLLFDISTREKLMAMDGQFFGDEEEEAAYLWENRFDSSTQCLTMDVTFFIRTDAKKDLYQRQQEVHIQRGHSIQEVESLLTQHDFSFIQVQEAFTRHAPTQACPRIQVTARKNG